MKSVAKYEENFNSLLTSILSSGEKAGMRG